MASDETALDGRTFDVVVLGSGGAACCIAAAVASRGASVLLASAGDPVVDAGPIGVERVGGFEAWLRGQGARSRAAYAERERLLRGPRHVVRPMRTIAVGRAACRLAQRLHALVDVSTLPRPTPLDRAAVERLHGHGLAVEGHPALLFWDACADVTAWAVHALRGALDAGARLAAGSRVEAFDRDRRLTLAAADGRAITVRAGHLVVAAPVGPFAAEWHEFVVREPVVRHSRARGAAECGLLVAGESGFDLELPGDDAFWIGGTTPDGSARPAERAGGEGRLAVRPVDAVIHRLSGTERTLAVGAADIASHRRLAEQVCSAIGLPRGGPVRWRPPLEEPGSAVWWRHGESAFALRRWIAAHRERRRLERPVAEGSTVLHGEVEWLSSAEDVATFADLLRRLGVRRLPGREAEIAALHASWAASPGARPSSLAEDVAAFGTWLQGTPEPRYGR